MTRIVPLFSRDLPPGRGATRTSRLTALVALLPGLALLLAACATPIGVVRGSTQEVQRALTANALSAGRPSEWSMQVLHRNNLVERFADDPARALADLHAILQSRVTIDRLFALSELSFLHAERSGDREYYLAAAVYAYAFVLPEEERSVVAGIDPRGRLAVDLYNLGISRGLQAPEGDEVVLEGGTRRLPFGTLTLTVDPVQFRWAGYRFSRFVAVGEFIVRGLRNRYRQAGVGAPLAAELEPVGTGPAAEAARKRISPRIKAPVTAFVRIAEPLRSLLEGRLQASIEVYAADQTTTVRIGQRETPLQLEPTAALGYDLEGSSLWDFEIAGFRRADPRILADGLAMLYPYRLGRVPVVFVHGTASSPARWAEMYNELENDPVLHGRYQYWFFQYDTGQPILYSAMLFRRALHAVVAEVDPEGKDEALRRMAIIGHSQGGLLAKLLAVDSGTSFWNEQRRGRFEDLELPAEAREILREGLFFKPFPLLARVVFISTPQRGSYLATDWARYLVRRFVTLPGNLVSRLHTLTSPEFAELGFSQLPTSVDDMSPNSRFIRALADLPIDPRITANSIIAVRGEGPPAGQTDGVVAYESAHIDGVESEKIVRSGHSTQGHPETIEEVRRILREHLGMR